MDNQEKEKKLLEILHEFKVCMFTTHDQSEGFYSRPMAITEIDQEDCIWFITNKGSTQLKVLHLSDQALITAQNGFTTSLTLNGNAEEINNNSKLKSIWKPVYDVWFKDGIEDPEVTLIKFTAKSGEYWDNSGMLKIKYLIDMTKAKITGEKIRLNNPEINSRVNL